MVQLSEPVKAMRVKSSVIKSIVLYGIGFGLLALIVSNFWESRPAILTEEEQAQTLLSGGLGHATIQSNTSSPGLKDLLKQKYLPGPILLATALWVVAILITFLRWHLLVVAQGLVFSRYEAIRLSLVSYFFNTFLPGAVGGDVIKSIAVARGQSRRTVAVATVIIDRIVGLWALAWFVAISGGFFWITQNYYIVNSITLKIIVQFIIILVLSTTAIWWVMGRISQERAGKFSAILQKIPKVGGAFSEFWNAGMLYRRKQRSIVIALLMSIFGHFCWVGIFYLCVSAFPNLQVATFTEHILIVPIGMTAQALFPLPGGIGGGEAAYGGLYALLGKPAIGGIVGCLVMRLIAWVVGLLGYMVFLSMKPHIPKEMDDYLQQKVME
ncbi:MAG: lysylphosphatidylglycerol synthase transmembrane domain-containing protein [Zavarzinella sp.]